MLCAGYSSIGVSVGEHWLLQLQLWELRNCSWSAPLPAAASSVWTVPHTVSTAVHAAHPLCHTHYSEWWKILQSKVLTSHTHTLQQLCELSAAASAAI